MTHNLLIANYLLGHSRSIYNANAFKYTHIYQEYVTLLPHDHCIWADSVYFSP
jgi:hypothetical protein